MVIEDLLKNVELPAIYKREGKDCYYDTYRKKLIEITPEEIIRQKVAALFEHQYGVPKDMILLEVPMSFYVEGASGRADIVIHMYDEEEQCLYSVTVIECKNEKVFLTDNVSEQAIKYSDTIGAKYIVVTNGIDLRIAAYDEDTDQYVFLDKILTDRFGETQIVSLSIFGTDAGFRGEKRNSYTSMTVAIDRFKTSHNSLQYNVDRFVKLLPDGKAAFLHNGQISSMKSDEIVAMVSQHGDGIRVGSVGIELGTIDINKLLYLDDKDVSELIYSFIEYALLREEVRRRKKKER